MTVANSQARIIELLNDTFNPPKIFSDQRIKFGLPSFVDGGTYDSEVTASSIPGMGYYGDAIVRYSRVDLSVHPVLQLASLNQFTIQGICDQFNGLNGSWLTPADLTATSIPTIPQDQSAPLVLQAADTSLGYKGTITVTLQHAAPQLAAYVLQRNLGAPEGLKRDKYGHAAGRDWYWNLDFTSLRDAIALKPVQIRQYYQGQSFLVTLYIGLTDIATVFAVLRSLGYPTFAGPGSPFYSPGSWGPPTYSSASDSPTSAVADSNQAFDRVVRINNWEGANPANPTYLHYNVLENR